MSDYPLNQTMFELVGSPSQNALVASALRQVNFPLEVLRPSLEAEGKSKIRIEWADLSRWSNYAAQEVFEHHHARLHTSDGDAHPIEREIDGRMATLGLFYLPPHTKVVLSSAMQTQPQLAREVLLAELAHAVDYHYMDEAMRRQVVNTLHVENLMEDESVADGAAFSLDGHTCSWFDVGPYEMWVGEAFMETFTEAFSTVPVTISLGHPTSLEAAEALWDVLMEPIVFTGSGEVYHDSHQRVTAHQHYPSAQAARAAGYRACRICKPKE